MSLNEPDNSLISFIKKKAETLGFIAMGVSQPGRPLFFDRFREWIASGKQGGMLWLEKHLDLREDPKRLLNDCNSIISLAYPYASKKPVTADGFTAARYAEPQLKDYHDRLREPAQKLIRILLERYSDARARVCIDSAPILERSFAHAAGLGFIGKNNALIVPGFGSYVFLVEILTTLSLAPTVNRAVVNGCGSCERCLKACPTGALEAPFSVDAGKCLSYLTIEYSGEIDYSIGQKMGRCFLGCDVCQEVCPFNDSNSATETLLPSTEEILDMEEKQFNERLGDTALKRAGLAKIKRNIRLIKGLCHDPAA